MMNFIEFSTSTFLPSGDFLFYPNLIYSSTTGPSSEAPAGLSKVEREVSRRSNDLSCFVALHHFQDFGLPLRFDWEIEALEELRQPTGERHLLY